MTMQAGLGASKLLILVGAGVGGSIVLRNSKLSSLLSDLSKVFSKHLQEEGEGSSNDAASVDTETILMQVRRLAYEMKQMQTSQRPITVVNGTTSSGGNYGALVLPVAVIGVAGYGYLRFKGWSLGDVMYVTRRNMSNAVASVSKQLENVSTALVATKRQLTLRLDFMSKSLEEAVSTTKSIEAQVGEVIGEVSQVGLEMREVNRQMEGLEEKLGDVAVKQEEANKGIFFLCQFVLKEFNGSGEMLKELDGTTPQFLQGSPNYPRIKLDRTTSTPFPPTSGLKDLQDLQKLSDRLTRGISASQADAMANVSSPSLQRSITSNNLLPYLPRIRSVAKT